MHGCQYVYSIDARGQFGFSEMGSEGAGWADHSGELRRGRRECFNEQVIDINVVGVLISRYMW